MNVFANGPIDTRAAGKVVWIGEYAVLDGAPALVCGVDRAAKVRVTPLRGSRCEIVASNLDGPSLQFHVAEAAATFYGVAPHLALAARIVDGAIALGWLRKGRTFRCAIDSSDLHVADGKLGLGSSAAVSVALARALRAVGGVGAQTLSPAEEFRQLDAWHRAHQRGAGSGIDIAAAVYGGLLQFRRRPGEDAQCEMLTAPAGLYWCGVYTGHATSTPDYLARLGNFRRASPGPAGEMFARLTEIAQRAIRELAASGLDGFLDCIGDYHLALAALGEHAGIDIVSREHQTLAAIANDAGVAYKCSGAGGGDLGLAFATGPEALERFRETVGARGFAVLPLAPGAIDC